MQDQIDMICTLTGCDQTMAREVFNETNDVTLAVDKILFKTELPSKKKQVRDAVSKKIAEIRETMKEFDKKMDERPDSTINQFPSTLSSRLVREVLDERQVHREETVLQNNYSQEYQLPFLQSEAEKPETVCQSQSESTCDSPLNDQT
jgi:hypothetical protein